MMHALATSPDLSSRTFEPQSSSVAADQPSATIATTAAVWPSDLTDQSSASSLVGLANQSRPWTAADSTQSVWWGTTSESPASHDPVSNLPSDVMAGCPVVDKYNDYFPWSNPDNVISLDTRLLVTKVCGVFIPAVCLLGAPLNIVNCAVFFRLGLRDRINFLLFSLALADLMVEVSLFCNTVEYLRSLLAGEFSLSGPFLKALINSGATSMYGFTYVSGFLSAFISFERCLCITRPFKARAFLRTGTTALVVLLAAVCLVGLHYFVSEKYKMGCEYVPQLRASISAYFASEFYRQNTEFVNALNVIVFGLVMPSFFVLVTTVTTVITAARLRRTALFRQKSSSAATAKPAASSSSSSSAAAAGTTSNNTTTTSATAAGTTVSVEGSKEISLIKMLIAVSCLFIACTTPSIVIRLAPLFLTEMRLGGRMENLLHLGTGVLYCTGAVNSSLNFFFYYKMGSKFRSCLQGMMCLQRRRPPNHDNNSNGGEGRGMSSRSNSSTTVTRAPSTVSVVSQL